MSSYQFKLVDAFTLTPLSGNSCGVLTHAEGLSTAQMQAIAREVNAPETAFVTPSERADFRVRFFTPKLEIPLAGHPTIATMHALAEEGRIDLAGGKARVTQELNAGVLPVDLERTADGQTRIVMTQARPQFLNLLDPATVAGALRISVDDLLPGAPLQVISTGTPQAMIPVRSLEVLERLQPDMQALAELEGDGAFFSTHVFTLAAYAAPNQTHARHFGASAGFIEDPVTGSATGGMAAYLWKHGLLRQRAFSCEQGHIMGRPGVVDVEVDADGDTPTTVRIAGGAVTVITGTISV